MLIYINKNEVENYLEVGIEEIDLDESSRLVLDVGGMIRNGNLKLISDSWSKVYEKIPKRAEADPIFSNSWKNRITDRNNKSAAENDRRKSESLKNNVFYSAEFEKSKLSLTFYV